MRHADGGNHDQRRQDIGQDLAQHDMAPGSAQCPGGFHVFDFAGRQGLAADHAARHHPFLIDQDQQDVLQARPHHGDQGDGENQIGKAEQDIDHPGNHNIGPAAQVAGGEAGHDANAGSHRDHDDADEYGNPRPIDDARQDIAAQGVAAQQIGPFAARHPGRRLQPAEEIGFVGILWCKQGRGHS
jgi:hypothetical protein